MHLIGVRHIKSRQQRLLLGLHLQPLRRVEAEKRGGDDQHPPAHVPGREECDPAARGGAPGSTRAHPVRGDVGVAELDAHGRRAANWLISFVIYSVMGIVLSFVIIGIPLLIVLAICSVVFPILAGLKANNGELWDYPGAIEFFPDPEHEPARY